MKRKAFLLSSVLVCTGLALSLKAVHEAPQLPELTDEMLADIRGGGDGPGSPPTKWCKVSPANCTVTGCTTPGATCTTCAAGPGSFLCSQDGTGPACSSTGIIQCPNALQGTCTTTLGCFTGGGAPTAECGVHYTCS